MDRVQSLFDDMLEISTGSVAQWAPSVDIRETEKSYIFHFELPGVEKENVTVELTGDTLVISGKREEAKEDKEEGYVRRERHTGRFLRSFRLHSEVKPADIKAGFKNGVLTVVVPKMTEAVSKQIPVT